MSSFILVSKNGFAKVYANSKEHAIFLSIDQIAFVVTKLWLRPYRTRRQSCHRTATPRGPRATESFNTIRDETVEESKRDGGDSTLARGAGALFAFAATVNVPWHRNSSARALAKLGSAATTVRLARKQEALRLR